MSDLNGDAVLGGEREETAEEILGEIIGEDGNFKREFSELFAKYNAGAPAPTPRAAREENREPVAPPRRSPYAGDPDKQRDEAFRRYSDRLAPSVREIVTETSDDAEKPHFVPDGTVRYPTMGVGESQERVVFDADWEERARKEAARREQIRRENMLRGDSTYARSFRFGGAGTGYQPRVQVNPAYIDPLDNTPESRFEYQDLTQPLTDERTERDEDDYESGQKKSSRRERRAGKARRR